MLFEKHCSCLAANLPVSSVCPLQGRAGKVSQFRPSCPLLWQLDRKCVCERPWLALLGWTCHCTRSLSSPVMSPHRGCPAAGKLRTRTSRYVKSWKAGDTPFYSCTRHKWNVQQNREKLELFQGSLCHRGKKRKHPHRGMGSGWKMWNKGSSIICR